MISHRGVEFQNKNFDLQSREHVPRRDAVDADASLCPLNA